MTGPAEPAEDGRRRRGRLSRTRLLRAAADRASEHGLDSLSIGTLAAEAGLSKSGVAALYRTKVELQLAVVDFAVDVFVREVVDPARERPHGLARLDGLVAAWASYVRREVFPGGCFVQRCLADQTHRPGPVRDAVTGAADRWVALLRTEAGRVAGVTDPGQLAFELDALLAAGNRGHGLGDAAALDRAVAACRERLDRVVPTEVDHLVPD